MLYTCARIENRYYVYEYGVRSCTMYCCTELPIRPFCGIVIRRPQPPPSVNRDFASAMSDNNQGSSNEETRNDATLSRPPGLGMEPKSILIGDRLRHVVHDGALKIAPRALELIHQHSVPLKEPDEVIQLPSVDSVIRPTLDKAPITVTYLREEKGFMVPSGQEGVPPIATVRTLAVNQIWNPPSVTPEADRLRGGGVNDVETPAANNAPAPSSETPSGVAAPVPTAPQPSVQPADQVATAPTSQAAIEPTSEPAAQSAVESAPQPTPVLTAHQPAPAPSPAPQPTPVLTVPQPAPAPAPALQPTPVLTALEPAPAPAPALQPTPVLTAPQPTSAPTAPQPTSAPTAPQPTPAPTAEPSSQPSQHTAQPQSIPTAAIPVPHVSQPVPTAAIPVPQVSQPVPTAAIPAPQVSQPVPTAAIPAPQVSQPVIAQAAPPQTVSSSATPVRAKPVVSAVPVAPSSSSTAPAPRPVVGLSKVPPAQYAQHIPGPNDEMQVEIKNSRAPWYTKDAVSEIERTLLPEWFDESAHHRTPESYIKARQQVLKMSTQMGNRFITNALIRRTVPGDAGSLNRLFHFLMSYSFINADAINDSTPTASALRDSKKRSLPTKFQDKLSEVVLKKHKTDPGVINWQVVADQIGDGATAADCQKGFLSLDLNVVHPATSTERSITPDPSDNSDAAQKAAVGKDSLTIEQILANTDDKVLIPTVETALQQSGDLAQARNAAVAALLASQATQKAMAEEEALGHVLAELNEKRMQRLEKRIELLNDVEGMMEAERMALELERRDLYTARCRHWFGGNSS